MKNVEYLPFLVGLASGLLLAFLFFAFTLAINEHKKSEKNQGIFDLKTSLTKGCWRGTKMKQIREGVFAVVRTPSGKEVPCL